jgi:hypothetical protein
LTKPELFQSNSTSGTISVATFEGSKIDGFGSDDDLIDDVAGFIGSMGLKLMLAAKRGMLDAADDDKDAHWGPSN